MSDHERLSRELRHRADQTGGSPIAFEDVKRSANKMKWQQRAGAGAVAAVVLAIGIPAGFALVNGDERTSPEPPFASNSPTVTDTATTEPSPTKSPTGPVTSDPVRRVDLTADVEGHGGEPTIPYLFDSAINLPTGERIELDVKLRSVAPLGDKWVGLGVDDQGVAWVYFLGADGSVTDKVKAGGYSLAVSPDGTQVAYSTADHKIFVAWDGPGSPRQLPAEDAAVMEVAAVQGSGPCVDPETESGNGCTVFWTAQNDDGTRRAMYSSEHGIVDELPGLVSVTDVSADGAAAGFTSVSDSGSCSAVVSPETSSKLWETCDYSLGDFSPDGRYVIGHPAYRDGIGDGLVAVLDARTGKALVEYRTDTKHGSFVNDTVWESDDRLLTMLYDDGWALMRLGAEGDFASVSTGRIAGAAEAVPVFFPAKP